MKKGIIFLALSLVALTSFCAEIELVKDNVPVSEIVVGGKPTKSAQLAALELQYHIKLITGATLEIVPMATERVKTHIVTGSSGASTKEELTGETGMIKFSGNDILIYGNDTPDYGKVDYAKEETFPPVAYHFKGTLFAMYDFLELYCNVFFYHPFKFGTTFQPRKTLSVKPVERRFSPPLEGFRNISGKYSKEQLPVRDKALWELRWRLNISYGIANHNAYGIYYRYWGIPEWGKNRPEVVKLFQGRRAEYFGAGFKGASKGRDPIMRASYGDDPDFPPVVCFTNPDVPKYFAGEAAEYAQGKNVIGGWKNLRGQNPADKTIIPTMPDKPFYYPVEPGDNSAFCACRNCQAKFAHLPIDKQYTNLKFYWISNVAKELGQINPKAGISTLAYINTLSYPEEVNIPENVAVEMCLLIYSWWHPDVRKAQEGAFDQWMKKEGKKRPMFVWTYIFGPHWDMSRHFREKRFFPGAYPWQIGKIMKKITSDGIKGWFGEIEMQYQPLESYIAAKLCYDPSLDPDKVIDEYFVNFYGKGAPFMKEFYRELENAYWNPANYPKGWFGKDKIIGPLGAKNPMWTTGLHSPEVNWGIGTVERVQKLDRLVNNALAAVTEPVEKQRIQYYIDTVWAQAVIGRHEYSDIPAYVVFKCTRPKFAFVPKIADHAGNMAKIDWNKGALLDEWRALNAEKYNDDSTIRVMHDENYIYLKYTGPAPENISSADSVDMFFSDSQIAPLLKLSCTLNGSVRGTKFEIINDTPSQSPYDFKQHSDSKIVAGRWTFDIAIPLKRLPDFSSSEQLRGIVNFVRNYNDGKKTIWSPVICSDGTTESGQKYFGKLCMTPEISIPASKIALAKPLGHIISDQAASDGEALKIDGNQGWIVRWLFPDLKSRRFQIYVLLRTDAPPENDLAFSLGVMNTKTGKISFQRKIPLSKISGKKYQDVLLGTLDLDRNCYLFLNKFNKTVPDTHSSIYIDRIILKAEDN